MNFYEINFLLKKDWGFSITEIEDMLPWEREVYLALIQQRIEDEKANK